MSVAQDGYGQFCPLAKAAEVIAQRWTPLVLRELMLGSTRFGELRRGLPLMSPTLLSQRLKELRIAGVIEKRGIGARSTEYRLTPAGDELRPVIELLGVWGNRWLQARLSREDYDPGSLMWFLKRNVDPATAPPGRTVVQFEFERLSWGKRRWWLVLDHQCVDVCVKNPGYEIDLYVVADIRALVQVYLGNLPLEAALRSGDVKLEGVRERVQAFRRWFSKSPLAPIGQAWHERVLSLAEIRSTGG